MFLCPRYAWIVPALWTLAVITSEQYQQSFPAFVAATRQAILDRAWLALRAETAA
ncbi:hypothetical protein IQ268_17030 [Oculatella sp. LEGE 06141]|uniref:hypothetical protein n=1 Tax=Oculatella sp. LEGE 06141 TaxID=1828648 RepID=UPI001882EC22|nr:hypothetical protein [Oculatella sp. LEGE 06141]